MSETTDNAPILKREHILALIVLFIAALLYSQNAYNDSSACQHAIDNFYLDWKAGTIESCFLDVSSQSKNDLINTISREAELDVTSKFRQGDSMEMKLKITVPSFAALMCKSYPQLFTYSNSGYSSSKLSIMSEQEYIDEIYTTLAGDFSSFPLMYTAEIVVTAERNEDKEWHITQPKEFENLLLGNIYSYQNDDVQFLTFKELILPEGSGVKTTTVEVTSLFDDTTQDTTFSSPDVTIPLGDSAIFSDCLPGESTRVTIIFSIANIVCNDDNSMTATIKATAQGSEEPISLSASLFSIENNGEFTSGVSNENIAVSSEPITFDVSFPSSADYIIFNASSAAPMYFSTHGEALMPLY